MDLRGIQLTAEKFDRIESVGHVAVERFGGCEHLAVTGLEPGETITAFEIEGRHAAPRGPAECSCGHELVAASEVKAAFRQRQLVSGLERIERALDAREVIVGH